MSEDIERRIEIGDTVTINVLSNDKSMYKERLVFRGVILVGWEPAFAVIRTKDELIGMPWHHIDSIVIDLADLPQSTD